MGEFTLDREVARKKMQDFQLEDPATYVLELVQAAVLKGAERLDFEIDSDDMQLRFDGRPFTSADYDLMYNSLLTSETDPDVRARQRLAIGVNAALGSEPKYVRVVSGDGSRGAALHGDDPARRLRRGGDSGRAPAIAYGRPPGAAGQTALYGTGSSFSQSTSPSARVAFT